MGRSLLLRFTLLLAGPCLALAAGWASYTSRALGFSVDHPSSWKAAASSGAVAFRSGEPAGEFTVRVSKAVPLAAWAKSRREAEVLPDGSSRVEKVSDTRLAGLPAKRVVLFAFDRYVAEEAVLAGGRLYVLEYDSDNPNDPDFARHKEIYARMRSSFRPR